MFITISYLRYDGDSDDGDESDGDESDDDIDVVDDDNDDIGFCAVDKLP